MRKASPALTLAFLAALAFSLATAVELEFQQTTPTSSDDGAFTKLLGDGRRLFSGQFVEMADVYLHSGFYPSIFDDRERGAAKAIATNDEGHEEHRHDEQGNCVHEEDHAAHQHDAQGNCNHEAVESGHDDEHEKAMSFMGQPRDPLEAFIRNFRITQHSHLENGEEKEIIPWLKLAIELNPQAIDTYVDTSFWLRSNLKRVEDAREVLREGIRNNPKSFELLFAMGQLYKEEDKNVVNARNIWLAAKRFWEAQPTEAKTNSTIFFGRITGSLARLEEESGNWQRAIDYFEMAKSVSPKPEAIQMQINDILPKHGGSTNLPSSASPTR